MTPVRDGLDEELQSLMAQRESGAVESFTDRQRWRQQFDAVSTDLLAFAEHQDPSR